MFSLLIRNSSNIERSILAVKVFRNLLKWSVPCFDQEEVDDSYFKGEEDAVADVVFPLKGFEGDGVDVLVCGCALAKVRGIEWRQERRLDVLKKRDKVTQKLSQVKPKTCQSYH